MFLNKERDMNNFWQLLHTPFFALAPMADVTDVAFREMFVRYGKPDVFWTEFVSVDGLVHQEGREHILSDLQFTKGQHPIVAQVFGGNPVHFPYTAELVEKLGFDGIDINMGCPDRSVEKQGAGAGLMKDQKRAREIIRATKSATTLPVSVKTRIGYSKNEIDTWIPALLETGLAAITIHGRTRKEMSDVPAHWNEIARVVNMALGSGTRIIGNGDLESMQDGRKRAKKFGVDGVMVGRGVFGNPWFFSGYTPRTEEKLHVLIEHTKLFENKLGAVKNFSIMKKHYKAYANGFNGAKELRMELMNSKDANHVEEVVKRFLSDKIDFSE